MRAVRGLFRFLCAAVLLMFLQGSSAQELASLDLSDQMVTKPSALDKLLEYNKEHCPGGGMRVYACGATLGMPPSRLKMSIVSWEPRKVGSDDTIKLVLKLENISREPIMIPWQREEQQYDPLAESNDEHPFAYLGFRISDRHDLMKASKDLDCDGSVNGELFAVKGENASFQEIPPGKWVTLITAVKLRCYQSGKFWISISWYEDVATVSHSRCYVGTGQYSDSYSLSDPVAIEVVADEDDD